MKYFGHYTQYVEQLLAEAVVNTDPTLYTNSLLKSENIAKVITYDELLASTLELGRDKNQQFGRLTTTCGKMFAPNTVVNVPNASGGTDAVEVNPEDKAVLYYPTWRLHKRHPEYYAKIIRGPGKTVGGPDEICMQLYGVKLPNLTTIACGTYTEDGDEVDSELFASAMNGLNPRDLASGGRGVNEAGITITVSQHQPDDDLIGRDTVDLFLLLPSKHFKKHTARAAAVKKAIKPGPRPVGDILLKQMGPSRTGQDFINEKEKYSDGTNIDANRMFPILNVLTTDNWLLMYPECPDGKRIGPSGTKIWDMFKADPISVVKFFLRFKPDGGSVVRPRPIPMRNLRLAIADVGNTLATI